MTVPTGESTSRRIGHSLGWSTASSLILRVGNFGVSLVVARVVAPAEFGVFAVALTVWSILGTLAEFGLGADLVRARDFERRAPTVAVMGLVTGGALALSMALAAPLIAAAFESPDSTGVIRLMSLSLAIFGFAIVPSAVLQREFRQRALFLVNGTALLISATTTVTFAVLGTGPVALALGQVVNQVVIVVGVYFVTRRPLRLAFDRRLAADSARFCLPLAFANLLSWVLLSVDNLVVARVLSPIELGLYVLAFNVSSWPMNAVGQAVRVVALPAFSQVDGDARRDRALTAVVGPLWAVALLLGMALATLAGPVVEVLYGERWSGAAAALTGLGLFGAIRVVCDLIATFLIAAGVTTQVLVVQFVWLGVMVPAMYVAVESFGLAGAGWAHVIVALGIVVPAYAICLRRLGIAPIRVLRVVSCPQV